MPQIACLVLAAGRSTRMEGANKLLADMDGEPMVRRVVATALASSARPVLVVTGHQAQELREALSGLDITLVHNPSYTSGLSTSLKAGVAALPQSCDGALVLLGDMPKLTPAHLDRLIAAFAPEAGAAIIVPTHQGRRGNPVLWSAAFFPAMQRLEGDVGARSLLLAHAGHVREIELATPAILTDIDTPEDLLQLRRR